ncbi:hypothetical protein [Candidatus Solirubrobacter pratensis]|uniref:hypothetical protein n=1 Tax=Candidatus Solirubrobacter pratensis TaxID=1298857 RepID=UPI00040DAAE2|nr:hypothetical protein [Candidatus Solirubrobacter pratensis]
MTESHQLSYAAFRDSVGAAAAGREPIARELAPPEALRDGTKVLGLGAPISMFLRLDPRELPLLRARVRAKLAQHDSERPEGPLPPGSDSDRWVVLRATLEDMLAGIEDELAGPVELLWPTTYAHEILQGALIDALEPLQRVSIQPDALQALAEVLDTARACLATWIAFEAVDGGGLQNVDL